MTPTEIVGWLGKHQITLMLEDDDTLKIKGKGQRSPVMIERIRANKEALKAFLESTAENTYSDVIGELDRYYVKAKQMGLDDLAAALADYEDQMVTACIAGDANAIRVLMVEARVRALSALTPVPTSAVAAGPLCQMGFGQGFGERRRYG